VKNLPKSKRLFLPIFGAAFLISAAAFYIFENALNPSAGELNPQSEAAFPETPPERPDRFINITLDDLTSPLDELGPINSIVISQHGEMVSEQYFGSMHAGRTHNIKSASKSILSILTGIAIDKGYLEDVNQPIGDFFPEYFDQNPDTLKASITIEDLLTMRSGLASTSRANYGRWVTSNNWIHYALDRPMQGTPGVDRIYSTGNTHLLAVILTRASGMNTLEFANRYLFGPLNIRVGGWDRDPQGYYLGGNNMAMRPADLIKIGQLMMDAGVYNDEQIVSREWVIRSIEPVTGRRSNIDDYGYLWFRRMANDYHVVYAFGNGGQYIMIVPELEAVIAVTTRNNSGQPTRNYRSQLFQALDNDIVPYLESSFLSGLPEHSIQ
jgi:CubicO group peptidase (beta-lactamase class C family)